MKLRKSAFDHLPFYIVLSAQRGKIYKLILFPLTFSLRVKEIVLVEVILLQFPNPLLKWCTRTRGENPIFQYKTFHKMISVSLGTSCSLYFSDCSSH